MKNLFLLPTDKPSRLYFYKGNDTDLTQYGLRSLKSLPFNDSFTNQNIYITNSEEIKEGDWFTDSNNSLKKSYKLSHVQFANPKKIILTTDDLLIKDGVQKIDDDFLEWFVKNPSCEFVDLYEVLNTDFSYKFRITIPKEEQDKKLYSEEEVRNIVEQTIEKFYKHRYVETKSEMKELWFQQFKKK